MQLSAPVIVEELSVCSRHVRLKGQLHGARVDILADGVPDPVGGGIADWPDQWFDLNAGVTLQPGQLVRARQSLGADGSPPAGGAAATVQDRSTTRPQFIAPLVACSSIAVLGGLAPGADATVTDNGGVVLGAATAAGVRVVVPLNRAVAGGEVLTATTAACGAAAGPQVRSLPAEGMRKTPAGQLLQPALAGPVLACMRVLHFSGAQVGATLLLERADGVYSWPVEAGEFYGRLDPPLEGGEELAFWQEAPSERCEARPSERVKLTVDPGAPPAPWISVPPCPGSKFIHLDGLVPSATVKLMAGATELLVFEAAEEGQDLDLTGVTLTPGQQLTVVQGLCDVYSLPSAVPANVTAPAQDVRPGIPERLIACAGVVRVDGLVEGSFVEVYSERLKGRIGHAWSGGDTVDVLVSPPLLDPLPGGQMEHIRAEVSGCARGAAEREVEGQHDLPPFTVDTPLDGDRSVRVRQLLPGCLLDVSVDGQWVSEAWAGGPDVRVGVPAALREGQRVDVVARLCNQQRAAPTVTVAAPLTLRWMQPSAGGIELDGGFHAAGRVQAALPHGGLILVGTEESGLWTVQPGGPAFPLSLDWPTPLVRSLAYGTRGPDHLYCGTTNGLLETDPSVALPLLSWQRVNGLPGLGGGIFAPRPGATINDILIVPGRNLIVVATSAGVWWSPIPAATATGYSWSSDPLVNRGNFPALCAGPNDGVVAYLAGAPGGGFFVGSWAAAGLQWANTTPGMGGPPADARLTTVVARMANGALSSCAADRSRVYAALADTMDQGWLAVLRSDDGGQTWSLPYADPMLNFLKPLDIGGTIDMGYQAARNLRVGAHPTQRDTVLLAGRRSGLLGSTDAGQTWDAGRWPAVGDDSFHADCLCLTFDPNDPSGNTVIIGSDGGVYVSTDLGATWDSSRNERFPTIMFDARRAPATRALSAAPGYPGLLVGALQDNGLVYLSADGEPWRQFIGGDGFRAQFVTSDVALRGSNDSADIGWARWDGTKFGDLTPLEPPGYPAGTQFLPLLSRVAYPAYTDGPGGAPMVAIGGDDPATGDVFGLFDKGAATNPATDRFYWKKLGTVPFEVAGVGSLTGRTLLVGTAKTHLYRLDAATGAVAELGLPTGLGDVTIRWPTHVGGQLAFALAGNTLLRTTNFVSWMTVSGPPGTTLEALEVDRALDPPALIVAGSDGAWLSRDLGGSWQPSQGLPRRPHANHLELVDYGAPGRVVHLGTWNWSAWRARLT